MVDETPYSTDLAEMQSLIDCASKIGQSIGDKLDQIEKRVAAMHIDWKGPAAKAHEDAHKRWLEAARNMHDDLRMMREETLQAHRMYSDLQNHNQGMLPKT
jgi:WXG100 family type VII secretion target